MVGHLPKEIFKNCGLLINTEAPLLVLHMCDTSNGVICAGDQGNVGCFLGLLTTSSIIYLRTFYGRECSSDIVLSAKVVKVVH